MSRCGILVINGNAKFHEAEEDIAKTIETKPWILSTSKNARSI